MFAVNKRTVGNKMLEYRKKAGLTQAEVAERADISERTYADIERGNVNMRMDTLLAICGVLGITPDLVLIDSSEEAIKKREEELFAEIRRRTLPEREQIIKAIEECLAWLDL